MSIKYAFQIRPPTDVSLLYMVDLKKIVYANVSASERTCLLHSFYLLIILLICSSECALVSGMNTLALLSNNYLLHVIQSVG